MKKGARAELAFTFALHHMEVPNQHGRKKSHFDTTVPPYLCSAALPAAPGGQCLPEERGAGAVHIEGAGGAGNCLQQ